MMKYVSQRCLLLIITMGLSLSINAQSVDDNVARQVILDGALQAKLRMILSPQDFNNFNTNLDDFSIPYTLKSKATYYEAMRNGLNAGSAIVISPDDYYYVAYKLPNNNQIVYITNDKNCSSEPHDAIKIFANRFGNNPVILTSKSMSEKKGNHSCYNVYGNKEVKKNTVTPITTYASGERQEQQMTRKSAESIWTASVTNSWNMNSELANVVG